MKTRNHIALTLIVTALTLQAHLSTCNASQPRPTVAMQQDTLPQQSFVYAHSEDGYVNVRRQPSTKSEKLGELHNGGAGALYLGREGDWLKVLFHGEKAYVYSRYAQVGQAAAEPAATADQRYFYIVIATFENAEYAKKAADGLPDNMRRPVYRTIVGGKEKYRICESCFTSRDKALIRKKELDLRYGESDIWVWETRSLADCLYCPTSTQQGTTRITPLQPK